MVALSGWDFENQLTAPTQDGHVSENAADDCGETCDSMIIRWSRNLYISPDSIKDYLYGQAYIGYGYVSDLSHYLNVRGIASFYANIGAATARQQVAGNLSKGWPTVVLMFADRVNRAGGHFEVVIGQDAGTGLLTLANPWFGASETMTPYQFDSWYNGWVITAEATKWAAPSPPPPPVIKPSNPKPVVKPPLAQGYKVKPGPAHFAKTQTTYGIKVKPNHTCASKGTGHAGDKIMVMNWYSTDAQKEQWVSIQDGAIQGWVLVSDIVQ